MHTKAFLFQHVTNFPIAWLCTRSGGSGGGSYKTPRQVCCSINTLLKAHGAHSPGCLVTRCKRCLHWCSYVGAGPPQAHWESQMRRNKHHKPPPRSGKSLLLLRAVSSCCERRLQLYQTSVLRATKQGLNTQRLNGGIMAWVHDFYKYCRSSHCYLSNTIHEHCNKILKHCPASVYRTQQQLNGWIQLNCPGIDFQNSFYQLCLETADNSSHFYSIISK